MKQFRSILLLIVTILVCMSISGPAFSDDKKATKDECIAKTKSAVKLFKEVGADAALKKINDRKGPFVWKDSYVFCFEKDTYKMTGHPYAGRMLGMSMKDYMDVNGKPVFQEFSKLVKAKGQGWVEYMHAKKPGDKPLRKVSFVMGVPDTNIIIGAGVYEKSPK